MGKPEIPCAISPLTTVTKAPARQYLARRPVRIRGARHWDYQRDLSISNWNFTPAFGRLRNSLDLDAPQQSPERLLSILSSLAGSIGSLQSDVDREQALIMVKKGLILLEKKPEEQLPILLGLTRQIWFLKEDHQNQEFDAIRSGLLLTQAKPVLHVPILTELTDVMQIPRCRETASKLVENGLLQLKDDPVASSEIVQGLMITVSKNAA